MDQWGRTRLIPGLELLQKQASGSFVSRLHATASQQPQTLEKIGVRARFYQLLNSIVSCFLVRYPKTTFLRHAPPLAIHLAMYYNP
ncbi:MAG: hypothetical protein D3910_22640 [Candidatus Electrothrix sp. ATG2]|nr:hypothetical protein [Candidatus Electrothrix sp. ATG2]